MAQHDNGSVWQFRDKHTQPLASGEHTYDCAVIGAGITGLTTALLLARQGAKVVVLESREVAAGETLRTTAHLTEVLDGRLAQLLGQLGEEDARVLVSGHGRAIAFIMKTAAEANCPDCVAPMDGLLIARTPEQVKELSKELEAARKLGMKAEQLGTGLPMGGIMGLRVSGQAALDAGKYLTALKQLVTQHGVAVFTDTKVEKVEETSNGVLVYCERGKVRAANVVSATHSSIVNTFALHTRTIPNRSYVIAIPRPAGFPDALVWDMDDPYHYVRPVVSDNEDMLIVGGEDHRVGEEPASQQCTFRLIDYAQEHFGTRDVRYAWSGQILEPVDNLPYIGVAPGHKNVYVATGFSGNGMTGGTMAAIAISDLIAGNEQPICKIVKASRSLPLKAVTEYARHNFDVAKHLVKDHFSQTKDAEAIAVRSGAIVEHRGKKLAVYRDPSGLLRAVSAICTHLGCVVAWNQAEATWDCPCHGSRFDCDGHVVNGPATSDLKQIEEDLDEEEPEPIVVATPITA